MGRILRPKPHSDPTAFNAYFYTLISRDTSEVLYASRRQQFLVDQGYSFRVLPLSTLEGEVGSLSAVMRTPAEQQDMLERAMRMCTREQADSMGVRRVRVGRGGLHSRRRSPCYPTDTPPQQTACCSPPFAARTPPCRAPLPPRRAVARPPAECRRSPPNSRRTHHPCTTEAGGLAVHAHLRPGRSHRRARRRRWQRRGIRAGIPFRRRGARSSSAASDGPPLGAQRWERGHVPASLGLGTVRVPADGRAARPHRLRS